MDVREMIKVYNEIYLDIKNNLMKAVTYHRQ